MSRWSGESRFRQDGPGEFPSRRAGRSPSSRRVFRPGGPCVRRAQRSRCPGRAARRRPCRVHRVGVGRPGADRVRGGRARRPGRGASCWPWTPTGRPRAWMIVHDRAAGRTMVMLYVDRSIEESAAIAREFYAWAEEQGRELCTLREITETRLDASPFAEDKVQQQWLADAGYTKRRTFPQMTRPVKPEEATSLPAPREGVTIRRVETPRQRAAGRRGPAPRPRDARGVLRGPLQLLPGELPRVRAAAPGGPRAPLGPLVAGLRRGRRGAAARRGCRGRARSSPENAEGHEGSYIDYIGVHRHARGRGVAKALLHTVIADAA